MFEGTATFKGLNGVYPERDDKARGKAEEWMAGIEGYISSRFRPKHDAFQWVVDAVKTRQALLADLTDEEIYDAASELKPLLKKDGFTRELVGRAFALVREAAARRLGMPHFDVQLIGGYVLLGGMVAEMETGEGKTLVATLPACTMALAGIPVHIITVNDYLTTRDAEWMSPIFKTLGLTVGTIIHGKDPAARREAYQCDITYCTNKEVAFDYLRDRIVLWDRPSRLRLNVERLYGEKSRIPKLVMRGLHFAIVDEADSVLVDEARTPLIISSQAEGLYGENVYRLAMDMAGSFVSGKDYKISVSDRIVELTPFGKTKVMNSDWSGESANISDKQKDQLLKLSLSALHLFKPGKQYLVKDGKVQIIDEFTGRLMVDRSWEMGLHQMIEIKEGSEVTMPKQTLARISYQRFFRRYMGISGMTGTAREVAAELWSVYRMRVVSIKTNRPIKRQYLPDLVYATADQKWRSVLEIIRTHHDAGRPVLVGTRSVEASEFLSRMLKEEKLPHRVLSARQDKEESDIVSKAGHYGQITVATNMAGRGTDIRLGNGVKDLGGLNVIATERHEARRIDRQLFGRCGRQGDPGSCVAVLSLDDELISAYANKAFQFMAVMAVKKQGGFFSRWVGRMVFSLSQKSAERLHSQVRRNLMKVDEQRAESLSFSGRSE